MQCDKMNLDEIIIKIHDLFLQIETAISVGNPFISEQHVVLILCERIVNESVDEIYFGLTGYVERPEAIIPTFLGLPRPHLLVPSHVFVNENHKIKSE